MTKSKWNAESSALREKGSRALYAKNCEMVLISNKEWRFGEGISERCALFTFKLLHNSPRGKSRQLKQWAISYL